MSTARMSLGALFSAITTAANTAANTLNAVNDGVEMLNRTITTASKKQAVDHKFDLARYELEAGITAAKAAQEFQDNLDAWLDEEPNRREKFQQTYKTLLETVTNGSVPAPKAP